MSEEPSMSYLCSTINLTKLCRMEQQLRDFVTVSKARTATFNSKYCGLLVKHMKRGFSFESFAATVNVSQDTLSKWIEQHNEFSDAKSLGESLGQLFWEKIAIDALWSGRKLNTTLWIFTMKCRFKWTDTGNDAPKLPEPIKVIYNPKVLSRHSVSN